MATASRKFQNLRHPMVAVGLFSAAIAVLLIAAQCSSSEESVEDPATTTSVAESTPSTTTAEGIAPTVSTTSTETSTKAPLTTIPRKPTSVVASDVNGDSEVQNEILAEEANNKLTGQTASLQFFDDCDALLNYIRGEALERVAPHGLNYYDPWLNGSQNFEETGPAAMLGSASDTDPSVLTREVDFSVTNVQIEGVEEADIVKTDGRRIVGISNTAEASNELWIADVTSPNPELKGRLVLQGGHYQELYLASDRVFLIGTSKVGIYPPSGSGVLENNQTGALQSSADDAQTIVITEVALSDSDNPKVVLHLRVEGSYISSRGANGHIRVVISSPEKLGFVQPLSDSASSEVSAERFNRQLIQESVLDQWLPNYNLHDADGKSISSGQLVGCDKVYVPNVFSDFNQVSLLSFAANQNLNPSDAVSTMADGEIVYASPSNMYVSQELETVDSDSGTAKTVIHKFSLDSSGSAEYEASGAVVGLPLNQYAFHEYDGRLFVATTSGDWEKSESFVTVLEDDGSALRQVGQVGNLGRGEDIYAVRFIADKAYVVTFRQIDPLYVVDLSDPTNPTTKGELKITGYSAYLHPVSEDLLLSVGRDATTTGLVTGVKFSLFDISDPANPRTLDTLALEDTLDLESTLLLGDSRSRVEWDAKSFLWWKSLNLAVVPVNIPSKDFYGVSVLFVDTAADSPKIELISHISQYAPVRQLKGNSDGCQWYRVPTSSLNWISAIHWGMHVVISDTTVVKVCSESSGVNTTNRGVPDDHICQSISKRLREVEEYRSRISIEEIIEEIIAATNDSSSGGLRDLLARLQSSSVKHHNQVSICFSLIQLDLARQHGILRSIVISDDLWTLSRSYLQANDLNALASRAWLDVPS